jgi:hypothetical protein
MTHKGHLKNKLVPADMCTSDGYAVVVAGLLSFLLRPPSICLYRPAKKLVRLDSLVQPVLRCQTQLSARILSIF